MPTNPVQEIYPMKPFFFVVLSATLATAQTVIPDGTRLRVRLDQTLSSATADEGQTVELSVTEPVKIEERTVIPEGARVTGTVTEAQEKRRMGRAGKLDFSLDRVRAVDGEWIPLRYTVNKKNGESHAGRTGVITAGVAAVFWPAAPVVLLMKGKDTTINKGVVFDAFTDQNHSLVNSRAGVPATSTPNSPEQGVPNATPGSAAGSATMSAPGLSAVTVTSNAAGADIEIDGGYVGSTPTTLQLPPGPHQVSVKANGAIWQRTLQVTAGSSVTVNATADQRRLAADNRR
jgi:hypothetical protein